MNNKKITANNENFVGFEEVCWQQVRIEVAKINPELAKIVDEFDPGKGYSLLRVRYPYGTKICEKGKLYVPNNNGSFVTLADASISPQLRNKLNYNSFPLALILNKAIEVYIEIGEGRVIPFKLFSPGVTFGVWEFMQPLAVSINQSWNWSVSSGSRTLFILPKISDSACHLKLQRKYSLQAYVPENIFAHGAIFAEIFKHKAQQNIWNCELLFFTKKWLEPQNNNIGWVKLKEYWTREAWRQLKHWTHEVTFDLSWNAYLTELTKRKIKLKPYSLDTIKHLIAIGCGTIPAFRPADDTQIIAPTEIIQDAYVHDYGLKFYAPVIMQPDFLQPHSTVKHVYYSLQAPTLPVKPPKQQEFTSVMKMLRELKNLIDIFMEISQAWPAMQNSLSYNFSKLVKFAYFHTEIDPYGVIKSTPHMVRDDPSLLECPPKYGKRLFPENSPFFRGCVRIALDPPVSC